MPYPELLEIPAQLRVDNVSLSKNHAVLSLETTLAPTLATIAIPGKTRDNKPLKDGDYLLVYVICSRKSIHVK